MNTINDPGPNTFSDLTEEAAHLAARALGGAIAHLIARYVPSRLASDFALRVVIGMADEMNAIDIAYGTRPPIATQH